MVTCSSCKRVKWEKGRCDVQLEEGEVGVAVVGLAFALLHDIVLEGARSLGVVPVEAVEDLLDVVRPLRREVERGAHGWLCGCATLLWC